MKWVSMIVALILGVFLLYQLFLKKAPEGTPYAVAEQFYDASVANDDNAVRALCLEAAVSSVLEASRYIHSSKPPQDTFNKFLAKPKWQQTETKADFALTSTLSGKIMSIELTRVGEAWKISAVAY